MYSLLQWQPCLLLLISISQILLSHWICYHTLQGSPITHLYFLSFYPLFALIWIGVTVQSIVCHRVKPTPTDNCWVLHSPKNNSCNLMSCIFNVSTKLNTQWCPRLRNLRLLVLNYLHLHLSSRSSTYDHYCMDSTMVPMWTLVSTVQGHSVLSMEVSRGHCRHWHGQYCP